MSVTAELRISATGRHTNPLDLGSAALPFDLSATASLVSGTAVGQADRVFTDRRTLAASGTEDLDLAAVLLDAFGAAITFAKIKAIFIKAADGNTNDVVLTRPASNGTALFTAAGAGIAIKPGGAFGWFAPKTGVTVTPATGDLLTVTNSAAGTPVTYDIVIIGVSA